MKNAKGFTLVELVIVIVILGIMAAVAIPKFVDLGPQARNAAAAGVAGALASGSASNYAQRKATNGGSGVAITGANVCTAANAALLTSGVTFVDSPALPTSTTQFQIAGPGNCTAAGDGGVVTCNILAFGASAAAQPSSVICAN